MTVKAKVVHDGMMMVGSKSYDHPWCDAASKGDLKLLLSLVDEKASTGQLGSAKSKVGRAALVKGCMNGRLQVVQELLKRGAEVDCRDAKNGKTPLHFAVEGAHMDIVKYLIEMGADFEAEDTVHERSCLGWACMLGRDGLVDLLLDRGANKDAKDVKGCTPLILSSMNGEVACAVQLLRAGCDIMTRDYRKGYTCLDWAIMNGHEQMCELLLEWKAKMAMPKQCIDFAVEMQNLNLLEVIIQELRARKEEQWVNLLYALKRYIDLQPDNANLLIECQSLLNEMKCSDDAFSKLEQKLGLV